MDKNEMISFTKNAKNLAYEFIANVEKDDIIILRGGGGQSRILVLQVSDDASYSSQIYYRY